MKRLVWIGLMLLATGCATQSGGLSERDRIVLDGKLEDVDAEQMRQKTKIANLEKRVSQLEDMVAMLSRRTSMDSREVVRIDPDNSKVSSQFNHRPTEVVEIEDDVYQDIVVSDEKKRAYFGSSTSQSSGRGPVRAYDNVTDEKLPAAGEVPAAATAGSSSPMTFYQEGIDLYRQGAFADSRARFEKFLATRPDESYVDNALYWIGECFYGEGLYHEAAGYFHRIVQEYPNANKVPDAILKVSLTYQKLGKLDSAREMLRYLMDAFPGTEAARIGKEKYESMNTVKP